MKMQTSEHITFSWVLTVDFDKEKHLFSGKIETNYKMNAYSCSCGHTEIIIYDQSQIIEYACLECDNEKFNDVNMLLNNPKKFSLFKKKQINHFRHRIPIAYKDDTVVSKLAFMIIDGINLSNNHLIYREVVLYKVRVDSFGNLHRNYSGEATDFIEEIERAMIKYIRYHKIFSIPKNCMVFSSLDKLSFALKNKAILSGTYNLRNRNEKSILRTIYQQYSMFSRKEREIYVCYIEVIIYNFKDSNLVCRLLDMTHTLSKSTMYFFARYRMRFEEVIALLKSYNYTENQITHFLGKIDHDYMFEDLMVELDYIRENKILDFRKVPCNIKALHDEAIRCTKGYRRKNLNETKLEYTESQIEPCTLVKDYNIKLPNNNLELFDWADNLHNCMASYSDMIRQSLTLIYGFFKNEILIFAVEIKQGELIQASAKYNRGLNVDEKNVLDTWLQKFFPIMLNNQEK